MIYRIESISTAMSARKIVMEMGEIQKRHRVSLDNFVQVQEQLLRSGSDNIRDTYSVNYPVKTMTIIIENYAVIG